MKCSFKRQCFQVFKSYYNENNRADVDAGNTEVLQKTCKPSKVNAAAFSQVMHESALFFFIFPHESNQSS